MENIHQLDASRFSVSKGWADQITLPNGMFGYTSIDSTESTTARIRGWRVQTVSYVGPCIDSDINERAHNKFPILIEGVSVADFINKIATLQEFNDLCKM